MQPSLQKATSQQLKRHNSRLVLKTIYDGKAISRADIARQTHLTRTTVSEVVGELILAGLVEEIGYGQSGGGSRPMLVSVIDDATLLMGVDLANDAFRGGLIDLRGRVVEWVSLPMEAMTGDEALQKVYELIDGLLALAKRPVLGIGIGTPGLIDAREGIIREAVNLDWVDLPLGQTLTEKYHLPVYLGNDSHVAALGEFTFGKGPREGSLIVIKTGRGTSAGIVIRNELYHGDSSGAGEIGHVVVREGGDLCQCGHRGCLETVASTAALLRHAQQAAAAHPDSTLARLAPSPAELTFEQVVQANESGDPLARELVTQAGEALGQVTATLVGSFNIHRVLLAGGLANFGESILQPMRETMAARSLAALAADTVIEPATLGADIVVLGAAAMLLANELELV